MYAIHAEKVLAWDLRVRVCGKIMRPSGARPRGRITHVQRAYKNPQKQKKATAIRKKNCIIIARRDKTIRLFFSVTNASLCMISVYRTGDGGKNTDRGNSKHAISARVSIPNVLAHSSKRLMSTSFGRVQTRRSALSCCIPYRRRTKYTANVVTDYCLS